MGDFVKIDEIDKKILCLLISDARTRLKDMAKECNMSSVSVYNRIKRLRELGVITGATLFPKIESVGISIVATIGIETSSNEDEILQFIGDNADLIEPSPSIGKYDLCALVYAENIEKLDMVVNELRKRFGVRKVSVYVWSSEPVLAFENIDLQPKELCGNGQT